MAFRSLNIESLGLKAPLSHAAEVDAGARLLFISGLTAKTPGGETFAPGDERLADRKSTRLNSSHLKLSRMPSSA